MIPVRVSREFLYLRRPVLVAVSLADLRGPVSGVVELPLHLFWSGRDSRDSQFSLDNPSRRRELYRTVLREACSPDDLADFLDGGLLAAQWARLALPAVVRGAWENQHPALRPPAAPSGLPGEPPGARGLRPGTYPGRWPVPSPGRLPAPRVPSPASGLCRGWPRQRGDGLIRRPIGPVRARRVR